MFGAIDQGEEAAVAFFDKWQREVIAAIPKERLLIHESKDGYGPICEFLGLPVPEEEYPRVNDTKQQLQRLSAMKNIAYVVVIGLPVVASVAAYYLAKYFRIDQASISINWE